MTPQEIKDLEARAEEYGKEFEILGCGECRKFGFLAGARAQDAITRKATIDEVLGFLRGPEMWDDRVAAGWYADVLESKLKGDG